MALFAALAYAVTSSGRGGGGVDREKNLLTAAQVASYANMIRQAVTRMMLVDGLSEEDINFGGLTMGAITTPCSSGDDCVFAPEGGGVPFKSPGIGAPFWFPVKPSGNIAITGIGGTAPDMFLAIAQLDEDICRELNRGVGISGIPNNSDEFTTINEIDAAPGQPYACFKTPSDEYWYYHALSEK